MPTPDSPEASSVFDRYEAALDALISVPVRLRSELADAERNLRLTLGSAESAARAESDRLAKLTRTATGRYDDIVSNLNGLGVRLPARVRPTVDGAAGPSALAEALRGQSVAEGNLAAEIRAAQQAAERQEALEAARLSAAQQASDALRLRQESVRRSREAAAREQERLASEARAAAHRRRLVITGIFAIGLVAAIVALAFVLGPR